MPLNTLEYLSHEERENLEKAFMNIKIVKYSKANKKIEMPVMEEVSDTVKIRAFSIFEVIKDVLKK